jgi:hypothetical protein
VKISAIGQAASPFVCKTFNRTKPVPRIFIRTAIATHGLRGRPRSRPERFPSIRRVPGRTKPGVNSRRNAVTLLDLTVLPQPFSPGDGTAELARKSPFVVEDRACASCRHCNPGGAANASIRVNCHTPGAARGRERIGPPPRDRALSGKNHPRKEDGRLFEQGPKAWRVFCSLFAGPMPCALPVNAFSLLQIDLTRPAVSHEPS